MELTYAFPSLATRVLGSVVLISGVPDPGFVFLSLLISSCAAVFFFLRLFASSSSSSEVTYSSAESPDSSNESFDDSEALRK